jgi:hypothetical protein
LKHAVNQKTKEEKIDKNRSHIDNYNQKTKAFVDDKRPTKTYGKGEFIWLTTKNLNRKKLDPQYIGPFQITEKIGEVTVKLNQGPENGRRHETYHINNLKKYYSEI